jgi:hypothetical protein
MTTIRKLQFVSNISISLVESVRGGCVDPEDVGLRVLCSKFMGILDSDLRFSTKICQRSRGLSREETLPNTS